MKDQEIQSLTQLPSLQALPAKTSDNKRSSLHFLLTLAVFTALLLVASSHMDRLETLEDKIKTGLLYLNMFVVFAGFFFLPSPKLTGIMKYFFRLVQSFAFAYWINLMFATMLVG